VSERPGDQDEWWAHNANRPEDQQYVLRNRPRGPWLASSIVLIAVGVLLFLGNLGLLPVTDIWVFWPAMLIAFGFGNLFSSKPDKSWAGSIFLILFGSVFLFNNLGWIHFRNNDGSWIVSLVLIMVGVGALSGWFAGCRRNRGRVPPFTPPAGPPPPPGFNSGWRHGTADPHHVNVTSYENAINDFVAFGALKRKLETNDFRGGQLTTIFGSIEIDLRRAVITPEVRSVVINVLTLFGATKIRVPETWRVIVSGSGVLGNFEDKTIPPAIGPDAPTLIIAGFCMFGSVELED
jgi:hypothetical protein